jgi:hypothetical protein
MNFGSSGIVGFSFRSPKTKTRLMTLKIAAIPPPVQLINFLCAAALREDKSHESLGASSRVAKAIQCSFQLGDRGCSLKDDYARHTDSLPKFIVS